MHIPPLSPDEPARLAALHATCQLDTPVEERFEVITRLARKLLDVPIAAVSLVDADRQFFKSISGLNVKQTSRDVSFCGHTIMDDGVMIVPDAREDPRFKDNPLVTGEPGIVFYAGQPICSREGYKIATLCVIDHKPRHPDEEDLQALRDLASMAQQQLSLNVQQSVATELLGQIESEQRNAMIDPLTRLWNRRGIDEIFERQLAECRESGDPVAVIIADADGFKQINDRYGHPVGDVVLTELARRLLAGAGQGNSVGRHGGEEFLIVPGVCTGPEAAVALAERMRNQLCDRPIQTEAGELTVTASFGVAFAKLGQDVDTETLRRSADAALYRAKADGRNRVRAADPLTAAA